jgi:hypothetical protein
MTLTRATFTLILSAALVAAPQTVAAQQPGKIARIGWIAGPVEQPSKYELVINRKAARTIGLDVPRSLTDRADRIIE